MMIDPRGTRFCSGKIGAEVVYSRIIAFIENRFLLTNKRPGKMRTRIAERIEQVQENIRDTCRKSGRDASDVKLVLVTKSTTVEVIKEVIKLGYTELAENRVQRLQQVYADINDFLRRAEQDYRVNWHMVGHLQRNKVKHVLPITGLIHSLDTLRLAEEINSRADKMGTSQKVLLQVNTSQEPQKYGLPVGAVTHLAEQVEMMKNLELVGLMTMAPLTRDEDVIRSCFARARELFVEMRGEKIVGEQFTELSMGMSSDYRIAIEEGATMLRIGSAVFSGLQQP